MFRFILSLLATAALTACTAPGLQIPAALPPSAEPAAPPPPPAATTAPPADLAGAMAASCRGAAAAQLSVNPNAITLSPAEETSLGFVVFGQAPGTRTGVRQFECSFGRDGALRVVRAA